MSRYQAYAEYKDFGVMWVDQIPGHWETSKLRYLFSFGKGLTITKENLTDEGVPCVNYGEVHSKFGFEVSPEKHTLKCVDYGYLKSSSNALLKNGDFVFADTSEDIDGSGNFTQLTSDSDAFAGYHTIIARPEDRKCTRFLAYVFDSVEFRTQIRTAVKGVKVFSITQAILRNADIWLPTYKERDQIANFLDHETAKIDLLIEKQQGLIALLKEKRQAVIRHAVTKGLNPNAPMKDSGVEWLGEVPEHWEVLQTRRVLVDMEQGKSPECESRSADIHEWGVLKTGCVNNGIYNSEENKFLPENISPFTQFEVKNGDVLMSRASGSVDLIGSVAYVHETRAKLLLSSHTKVF
jgi:type I restriction enzyme S subunit